MNQRQYDILEELKKRTRMSVASIADMFYVSEMTVRRDLKYMESNGYIQRYSGGAMIIREEHLPINFRKDLHSDQKNELAKRAKCFLHDSMNVFIDSSSTCMYVIPLIAEYKNMHIFTNSIQNILVAAEKNIPATLVGGDYNVADMCTVGAFAESFVDGINVDISFLSVLGLSDDGVFSDDDILQTSVRKRIISHCDKNIILLDSHKLHKKYLYTLCRIEDVNEVIVL